VDQSNEKMSIVKYLLTWQSLVILALPTPVAAAAATTTTTTAHK